MMTALEENIKINSITLKPLQDEDFDTFRN